MHGAKSLAVRGSRRVQSAAIAAATITATVAIAATITASAGMDSRQRRPLPGCRRLDWHEHPLDHLWGVRCDAGWV